MAAADSSPATFRVSPEERYLLEAVAHYNGQTLSAFVRDAALDLARYVVKDVGIESVLEGDQQFTARGRTQQERRALLEKVAEPQVTEADTAPSRGPRPA